MRHALPHSAKTAHPFRATTHSRSELKAFSASLDTVLGDSRRLRTLMPRTSEHCINAPVYQAAIGLPSVAHLDSKHPSLPPRWLYTPYMPRLRSSAGSVLLGKTNHDRDQTIEELLLHSVKYSGMIAGCSSGANYRWVSFQRHNRPQHEIRHVISINYVRPCHGDPGSRLDRVSRTTATRTQEYSHEEVSCHYTR